MAIAAPTETPTPFVIPPPLPGATRIVWSNASNPYAGVRTADIEPQLVIPLGDLLSPVQPSSPPVGYIDFVRAVQLTLTTGPTKGWRWSLPFARPWVPVNDETKQYGDGTPLASTGWGNTALHAIIDAYGQEGPGPTIRQKETYWTPSFPLTQHTGYWLADYSLVGDTTVFEVYIDRIPLPEGYKEVLFGMFKPQEVGGEGSPQYYALGNICSPSWGQGIPSSPYPSRQWIPILAEVNLSTGATSGDREATFEFRPVSSLSGSDETPLAHTGVRDTPGVSNNNATGGYANYGTGPHENTPGSATHVQFAPGEVLTGAQVVELYVNAQPGDVISGLLIFLSMPLGAAFPPS
jgi:hypothetical protein